MPIWSEYKVTFSENKFTLLNYLLEKGYFPYQFHNKYFMYSQFLNFKSGDLETSHIGLYNVNTTYLMYMPEDTFDNLNKQLSDISIDMLEYAFSIDKTEVILKRGIYLNKVSSNGPGMHISGPGFSIVFQKIWENDMVLKMCRLDLVKILDDERIGWVPFVPKIDKKNESLDESASDDEKNESLDEEE